MAVDVYRDDDVDVDVVVAVSNKYLVDIINI